MVANFKEIHDKWLDNIFPITLYINSPFCDKNCSYCVYRGDCNSSKETRDKFFNEHLVEQYSKYEDIINSNEIRSIYFGGGTPNLEGSLSQLIPIFEKVKNLDPKEKIIELHVGYEINDDQIDLLSKYNFTTVILCQQTFDESLLKKVNRINNYKNDLSNLIYKLHQADIKVGLDLIYFSDIKEGNDILKKDLEIINGFDNLPDEITVASNYLYRNLNNLEELKEILTSSSLLSKYLSEIPLTVNNMQFVKCFRFYSPEGFIAKQRNEFYSFLPALEESINALGEEVSTLGIGSFKNQDKWVYSCINQEYSYYEKCTNLGEVSYVVTSSVSGYDQIINLVNWMKEANAGKPLPLGSRVVVEFNDIPVENFTTNLSNPFMINFDISNCPEDYINNLNNSLNLIGKKNILLNNH